MSEKPKDGPLPKSHFWVNSIIPMAVGMVMMFFPVFVPPPLGTDGLTILRYRSLSGWFFRRRKPQNLRPWEVGIPAPFKRHISIEVFEWFSAVAKRREPA